MKKSIRISLLTALPIIAVIIFLNKSFFENLVKIPYYPKCIFYILTGYYCPGCGNTRIVLSLLKLDIVDSFKYNIAPPLLCIISVMVYFQILFDTTGVNIRVLPRKGAFWYSLLTVVLMYYFARNYFHFLAPGL